jgi:hypothetical protein
MAWTLQGQYMETCNCAFICPCISSNLAAIPTEGDCKAAIAMRIDKGRKDNVSLDGLSFILLLHSPKAMIEGNFTVGLVIDERATDEQADAIAAIASGAAGGPMAALAPLVGSMAGIEKRSIQFEKDGSLAYSVKAGELVDQRCEGVGSAANPDEPIYLENVAHPANSKLALAKATRSRMHAFGIDWEDTSGTRNGHFAPFAWAG